MPEGPLVDVIVPVYRGVDETITAITSVLQSREHNVTPFEILVILDNPQDASMSEALQQISGITLLRNEVNVGFVRSVNRGMVLHPDRDVLLLNSDTLVNAGGNWLDRLRAAAYAQTHTATVTPFSNNATICSYPRFCRENPMPAGETVATLDALCAQVNGASVAEIPTAVGFCMYIRRACMAQTGLFDVDTFGAGYGEENDFCMRAASLGWRHVLAAGVFVQHHGSVSFGEQKLELQRRNAAKLSELHPSYDRLVHEFIARDPLLPFRRELDIARIERRENWVALATNTLPGGVARHVRERAAHAGAAGQPVLILRCTATRVALEIDGWEDLPNLTFQLPAEHTALRDALLHRLGVTHLHIQQIVDMPVELFDLGLPYDISVHDYAWICPQVTLIDNTREYCGEPANISSCEQCYRTLGPHKDWGSLPQIRGVGVAELRSENIRFLERAETVHFPSHDAAKRMEHYTPAMRRVLIEPHEKQADVRPKKQRRRFRDRNDSSNFLRVAYIGSLGYSKGFYGFYGLALDALKRGLPIDFHVIGGTADSLPLQELGVRVWGAYDDSEVHELLNQAAPHLALFPGALPETYSYTLSVAFQSGVWPVAYDLGAIAERIRAENFGTLIPLGTSLPEINDLLLTIG